MRWWNLRSEALDPILPKSLTLFEGGAGGEGGVGGGSSAPAFDPKSVPADWLKTQVQNEIARATGGKGLDGLLNNNKELLSEKQKLRADLDQLHEKIKPLGDIEKAADLLKKFDNDEELKLFKDGKVDDLVKKRMDGAQQRFQAEIARRDQLIAEREKRESSLLARLQAATVDRELTEAAAKAGVHKTAITDLVNRGRGIFRLEESGDELRIVPKDSQGVVIFGPDGKTPLSPQSWVESLKESAPHFFPGSSGGGAAGGAGKTSGNAIVLPRQHTQAQFEAAFNQAQKEGRELKIAAS